MCPFCLKKKQTNLNVLTTDTLSSFIEAVDELFQHTLSYECMEHHVHTIAIICMWLLPILPPKKRILIESTAVTNCSFTEAVDELFHHTSGNECMKYGLAT